MTAPAALTALDRSVLDELVPVLRRAVALDPRALVRLRGGARSLTALVRLPFDVLVSRTVERTVQPGGEERVDLTVGAAELLAWFDGESEQPPAARDAAWRWAVPPQSGWRPVETVPDDVVRPLVRSGALALRDAAEREGVPGAQPRAEVADALLDATVLTVDDDAGTRAEVSLRAISALTRMGFLPRGGQVRIDVAGRWTRVVAEYGTVHLERPGGLQLR